MLIMFSTKKLPIHVLAVFLCIITVNESNSMSFQSCRKIDACSCVLADGNMINLHFAAHSESGKPVFQYQSSTSSAFFKYSPCSGLPCGGTAKNSSLCLESSFLRPSADLGTVSSVEFQVSGRNITLMYHASNGKTTLLRDTGIALTVGNDVKLLHTHTLKPVHGLGLRVGSAGKHLAGNPRVKGSIQVYQRH